MESPRAVWQRIALYLLATFLLSSVFYYFIIRSGSVSAAGGLYVLGAMWCPGVAALLTNLVTRRTLRGMGWGVRPIRYQLWSYLAPLGYVTAVYLPVWSLGLGQFNADFLQQAAFRLGWPGASAAQALAYYFVLAATVGVVGSCLSALGEEIGWRGLLVPELAKVTSFTRAAWISGAVWAVWHYPVLLFADYRGAGPVWYSLLCFTIMVLGINILFAWMRLRSGSLGTATPLHASHNLFIQGFYDRLTVDTGPTRYLTGEFGVGLAGAGALVGFLCWRKRNEPAAAETTYSSVVSIGGSAWLDSRRAWAGRRAGTSIGRGGSGTGARTGSGTERPSRCAHSASREPPKKSSTSAATACARAAPLA
jgi:membrane protease YdiL (CAAX protease family)